MPIIRRDSSAHNNDRPKREIHSPKRDLQASGPRPKEEHQAFAYPFMVPVHPVALDIPNYHKVIEKPLSLSTFHQSRFISALDIPDWRIPDRHIQRLMAHIGVCIELVGPLIPKEEDIEHSWRHFVQYHSNETPPLFPTFGPYSVNAAPAMR